MDINNLWRDFLKIINEEIGSRVVETWFKALTFSSWDSQAGVVYLTVPNKFVKEWIISNYQNLLITHLSRLINSPISKIVYLQSSGDNNVQITPAIKIGQGQLVKQKIERGKESNLPASYGPSIIKGHINPEYDFINFVSGPTNSLAYAAARAVAEKPGLLYNPLFIYGDSGLGKTHLLHAVGNSIQQNKSGLKILYQTADRFVGEFINAIRFDKVNEFEKLYKEIDVLLIDDIQFISNKEQTQEIFFHIFNTLYERRKQIVFTSDSLPKDIAGLADRLRTRLDGGLVTDIQIPTLETKIAILKKKSEQHGEQLPDNVAQCLAELDVNNIRQLEGLLVRLYAYAALTKREIDIDLAKEVCVNHTKSAIKLTLDLNTIGTKVAKYYSYTVQDLKSNKRLKQLALARHVAMYCMKRFTDNSLNDIATFFKKKDHSTIIYAIEKIEKLKLSDNNLSRDLAQLESKAFRE